METKARRGLGVSLGCSQHGRIKASPWWPGLQRKVLAHGAHGTASLHLDAPPLQQCLGALGGSPYTWACQEASREDTEKLLAMEDCGINGKVVPGQQGNRMNKDVQPSLGAFHLISLNMTNRTCHHTGPTGP